MEFSDLKRWHWAVVGLLVGLVFAYVFSDHDVDTSSAGANRELKQPAFERELLSRSRESHEPLLQNVKVEPPVPDFQHNPVQVVRGERLQYSEKYHKEFRVPFYFYATVPYVPGVIPVGTDPAVAKGIKSVVDYLAFAEKTLSAPAAPRPAEAWQTGVALRYRYAWEYESRWNTPLWAAGGLFLIGGIVPTLLNALVHAGLSKAPERKTTADEEYLNRFTGGVDEAKPPVKLPDELEQRRLEELNAALASGLAPSGIAHTAAPGETAGASPPSIRTLGVAGEQPLKINEATKEPEMSEEERKRRYAAGDFYPVARGPAKKP